MSDHTPLVSLLLVTMRPAFLPAIVAMLDRQTYRNTELIVGLHGYGAAGLSPAQSQALGAARAVLELPRDWSLGCCLNTAVAEARGAFVTKIDDDDLYGRNYLHEAVAHCVAGDGDVIGKAESYLYLEASGVIVLRKPGLSLRRVKYVNGSTLLLPRTLALEQPFRDITLREDTHFLNDCWANGKTVYSTSRRNYLYMRRADVDSHTAPFPDQEFIGQGIVVRHWPRASREDLFALIDGSPEENVGHARG